MITFDWFGNMIGPSGLLLVASRLLYLLFSCLWVRHGKLISYPFRMKTILLKTQILIQVLSRCENALKKSIPKCTSNVVNIDGGSMTKVAIRHVISLIYISQHFSMFAYCANIHHEPMRTNHLQNFVSSFYIFWLLKPNKAILWFIYYYF
jgi:hypothetical protein